jgi:hypothetical protein
MNGEKTKLDIVLALDKVSDYYRVKMNPEEAVQFASQALESGKATRPRLATLIDRLNDLIPTMKVPNVEGKPHPRDGRPHHWYLVGKEEVGRVVYLQILKTNLETPFPFQELFDGIRIFSLAAYCDDFEIRDEKEMVEVRIWWA